MKVITSIFSIVIAIFILPTNLALDDDFDILILNSFNKNKIQEKVSYDEIRKNGPTMECIPQKDANRCYEISNSNKTEIAFKENKKNKEKFKSKDPIIKTYDHKSNIYSKEEEELNNPNIKHKEFRINLKKDSDKVTLDILLSYDDKDLTKEPKRNKKSSSNSTQFELNHNLNKNDLIKNLSEKLKNPGYSNENAKFYDFYSLGKSIRTIYGNTSEFELTLSDLKDLINEGFFSKKLLYSLWNHVFNNKYYHILPKIQQFKNKSILEEIDKNLASINSTMTKGKKTNKYNSKTTENKGKYNKNEKATPSDKILSLDNSNFDFFFKAFNNPESYYNPKLQINEFINQINNFTITNIEDVKDNRKKKSKKQKILNQSNMTNFKDLDLTETSKIFSVSEDMLIEQILYSANLAEDSSNDEIDYELEDIYHRAYKVEKLNSLNLEASKKVYYEIYILGIFPFKQGLILIVACVFFWMLYKLIKMLNLKDLNHLILNVMIIFFTLIISLKFYNWQFYISSSVIFFICSYSFKNVILRIVALILDTNKSDAIFTSNPESIGCFTFNFSVLSILLTTNYLICFYYLQYILNYMLFYGLCFRILDLLATYIEKSYSEVEIYLIYPLQSILYTTFGVVNFIAINFFSQINKYKEVNFTVNSLYLVSDVASYIGISYFFSFLVYQNIDYFNKDTSDKKSRDELEVSNDEIDENDYSICHERPNLKYFSFEEDSLWLILLVILLLIEFFYVCFENYIGFIISIELFRVFFKVIIKIFHHEYCRIIISLHFLICLLNLVIITNSNDNYLIQLIQTSNYSAKEISNIMKIVLKLIVILYIVIIFIQNYQYLYLFEKTKDEEYSEEAQFTNKDEPNIRKECNISINISSKKLDISKEIHTYLKGNNQTLSDKLSSILKEKEEENIKFEYGRFILYLIDFTLNYLILLVIMYTMAFVEKNYFIKIFYDFLYFIFLLRVRFKLLFSSLA